MWMFNWEPILKMRETRTYGEENLDSNKIWIHLRRGKEERYNKSGLVQFEEIVGKKEWGQMPGNKGDTLNVFNICMQEFSLFMI